MNPNPHASQQLSSMGTHQSSPIRTDLCNSSVNENKRWDAPGSASSVPYLRGPGVRSGEHLNLLRPSDKANICINELRRLSSDMAGTRRRLLKLA